MENKLSLATKFFLLSGKLLINSQPKDWEAPSGEKINGNTMFEEAFLLEIHQLVEQKTIAISGQDKELKIKTLSSASASSGLVKFITNNLPQKEILFYKWVEKISGQLKGANPAQAMLNLMEKEAAGFKKEIKSKFLFFTLKAEAWDKGKINRLADEELEKLRKIWQTARKQSWWEDGRRMLRDGLTFARMRKSTNYFD